MVDPRFSVFKKEIELESEGNKYKYEILPLQGRYLPKFFEVVKSIGNIEDSGEDINLSNLDPKVIETLHELALATMAASYPDIKEDELNLWVTQNLFKLVPALIEVNFGTGKQ